MTFFKKIYFQFLPFILLAISISGCYKGKSVDVVIHNARIHTMNDSDAIFEAIAIKDGKIIEVGPEQQILNKYTSEEEIDAGGKDIYPGLTDFNGHIFELAKRKLSLDLTGTRSYDELLVRLEKYSQLNSSSFIVGRGLDTSLWNSKEKFSNERLNSSFSKIPVCLYLIGDEVFLANNALLNQSKIESKDGIIKGNSIEKIATIIPSYSKDQLKKIFLEIQNQLFQYGITGVHEAGVTFENLQLFKELVKSNQLKLNMYAMLSPSEKNYELAKKHKKQTIKNLNISSFYADDKTPIEELKRISLVCEASGYQMIISSGNEQKNQLIFDLYKSINEVNKDHRWRIESAQNLTSKEYNQLSKFGIFASIIPNKSLRYPTKNVAFKSILNQTGMIAIGSNFPFETFNPSSTIHIAVQGLNSDNAPIKGISPRETLTFEECIKGMTKWAAFSSFQESTLGTIEKGKDATFVIFEFPVISGPEFIQNYASMTFIKGKKVYSAE
jgi:predicted amidohydrolase YtcJ